MTAENLLEDIKKGFAFWLVASDEAYHSFDYPEEMKFVEYCISFGYYSELKEDSDVFKTACYHLGFINKEELDDWIYGGFRPTNGKLPDRLVICCSANWRHEAVVCANIWYNKKTNRTGGNSINSAMAK